MLDGIPCVYWFGQENGFNILVMELLEKSLETVYTEQKRHFSMTTILLIAD